MTTVVFTVDVDMSSLDLNRLYAYSTDAGLLDNVYATYWGTTFQDVYIVDWYWNGWYRASAFGGYNITTDALQNVTGGTVTGYLELGWTGSAYTPYFMIDGMSVSATSLYSAALTTSTQDDRAIIVAQLAGDDHIAGSIYDDVLEGHAGNDILWGNAGDDVIYGGAGTDTAQFLSGTRSQYTISAGANSQTVLVQSTMEGNDVLIDVEKIQFSDGTFNVADLLAVPSTVESHSLTVLVASGVLGHSPVLLKNLTEKFTTTGQTTTHTVEYSGFSFDYSVIDPIIMTVVRDGEFTSEFRAEIDAAVPHAAAMTYSDVVSLVGQSLVDDVIIHVAGLDGNYVG